MIKYVVLVFLCLVGGGYVLGFKGQDVPSTKDEIAHYLDLAESVWDFRGTILVAKDGTILFARGYGMADESKELPNAVETIFRLASITKTFTATAIMQLQERGFLNIDDPVSKYFSDFPVELEGKVSIRHVLNHTSGVLFRQSEGVVFDSLSAAEENVAALVEPELEFEPGTQFHYSDMGYILLGVIIEKTSGLTYDDYLQQHIFDPLGMHSSGYGAVEAPNVAVGYFRKDGEIIAAPPVDDFFGLSAGGVYSTVGDVLIWDQALFSDGVLSKNSRAAMFEDSNNFGYGLGWEIGGRGGHRLIGHSGGGHGLVTRLSRYVDDNVCIVILSNLGAAPVEAIERALASILFDLPYETPQTFEIVEVDPSILEAYTGEYEDAHSVVFAVMVEDDSLFLEINRAVKAELLPLSDTEFLVKGSLNTRISFEKDKDGKVTKLIHNDGGEELPFHKK